jgi:hypothetical protein
MWWQHTAVLAQSGDNTQLTSLNLVVTAHSCPCSIWRQHTAGLAQSGDSKQMTLLNLVTAHGWPCSFWWQNHADTVQDRDNVKWKSLICDSTADTAHLERLQYIQMTQAEALFLWLVILRCVVHRVQGRYVSVCYIPLRFVPVRYVPECSRCFYVPVRFIHELVTINSTPPTICWLGI